MQLRKYESWIIKIDKIKQLIEFRQCLLAVFEWKCQKSCFPFSPGSAEAQGIWGDIEKRLLSAYFIGNIFAKKMSKSVDMRERYSKPKVCHFLRHGVDPAVNLYPTDQSQISLSPLKWWSVWYRLHPCLSCVHNLFLTRQLSCHQGHPTETEMPCVYLVRAVDNKLVMTSSCTVGLLIRATTPRW